MKENQQNLKIIVLAAGKSERFEGIKLLAKIKQKDETITLIEHVLQQVSTSLNMLDIDKNNLYVATGGYHAQLSDVIGKQFSLGFCEHAHYGIGHTIAQSIEKILDIDEYTSHIMITLADQIDLTSQDYVNVINQSVLSPNRLVCAKAGDELMPPAIFPRHYFKDLMSLTGDKGAKSLLYKNRESLQEVLLPNAAVDIDTKKDLSNWHK